MARTRTLMLALMALSITLLACPQKKEPKDPAASSLLPMMADKAPPMVAKVEPANFARDLPPGEITLTVTFDRPLKAESWSWVQESPETSPEVIGRQWFDPDGLRAHLKVKLQPARRYVIWLNSAEMKGFVDRQGTPLLPFRWSFTTTGFKEASITAPVKPKAGAEDPPRVIQLVPADGATDVDPSISQLSVTFDREMNRQGWSWVKEGKQPFPEGRGQPSFDASGRVNSIPVTLKPATTYVLWINSDAHQDFEDTQGRKATPRRWSFTTRE